MTFALGELLLGLMANARNQFGLDLESFWILVCVTDATMRPFILNPALEQGVLTAEQTPDQLRGAISRRLISEETGLPRETVRRKAQELVENGFLAANEEGLLFARTRLSDLEIQRGILDGHRLVQQYLGRLEAFGLDPKQLNEKRAEPSR